MLVATGVRVRQQPKCGTTKPHSPTASGRGAKGAAAFGPAVKMEESLELAIGQNYNYYNRLMALCPGLPG